MTNIKAKNERAARRIKTEGYTHDILDAKQAQKRREAEFRQSVYDGLSVHEKIALARSRRGSSDREINRLVNS